MNWYNVILHDQPEVKSMQKFVEDELAAARSNKEKAMLVDTTITVNVIHFR